MDSTYYQMFEAGEEAGLSWRSFQLKDGVTVHYCVEDGLEDPVQSAWLDLQAKESSNGYGPSVALSAMQRLGEALWNQAETSGALHLFKKARDGFATSLEAYHLQTLRSVVSVCILSCLEGDRDEAARMLRWAYNGKSILPPLESAVLTNYWIRNENILEAEEEEGWRVYQLVLKDHQDIF